MTSNIRYAIDRKRTTPAIDLMRLPRHYLISPLERDSRDLGKMPVLVAKTFSSSYVIYALFICAC